MSRRVPVHPQPLHNDALRAACLLRALVSGLLLLKAEVMGLTPQPEERISMLGFLLGHGKTQRWKKHVLLMEVWECGVM